MRMEDLKDAARRQPFEPFRVILTTGDRYDIAHPDLIMVGRRAAVIGITNKPDDVAFERTLKVDLVHVVGIESLPSGQPTGNGPAK